MTDIVYMGQPVVNLIDKMGSDRSVTRAARVSVQGLNEEEQAAAKEAGLIKYLMAHQHGSPFEHAVMTFYVKGPIFTFREFMRHRMAGYNERSARYSVMPAEFYMPYPDRPMVNVGTSARPEMAPGSEEQYARFVERQMRLTELAWETYEAHLADGIANEMARSAHLVTLLSEMYVTINLRSLMNFLKLRIDHPQSLVRSHPQYEIQQVAIEMETMFAESFPMVHAAFVANGRVAP